MLLISSTKTIDDIEIYYEIHGKCGRETEFKAVFDGTAFCEARDDVLVLLHGNGEDMNIFSQMLEEVCEKNYCLLIDSRGHGKTSAGKQEFTIDLMAEDLSKLCDELNLGKFRLLGFSDGGNIALTYAARHPERLSALITIGANINPQGIKLSSRLPMQISYFASKCAKDKSENANLKYQLLSLMVNYPHISPRVLRNIECPALILDAQRDLISKKHTKLIADSIPRSQYITVPKSSHAVFYDNPQFVASNVADFLASI